MREQLIVGGNPPQPLTVLFIILNLSLDIEYAVGLQ